MTTKHPPMTDEPIPPPVLGWRLLTSPLTEEQARRAASLIEEAMAVEVIPSHPRKAWDRRTVEMIREALVRLADAAGSVPSATVANLDEWLEVAHPYNDDEPAWRKVT